MNDNAQPSDAKVSARRRLLRGAFAAPAVMTVATGNALAASSNLRCINNQVTQAPYTGAVTNDTSDGVLRIQLWALVKNSDGVTVSSYWVKGADVVLYKRSANTVFLASNQFQQFVTGSNQLTGSATTTVPSLVNYTFKAVAKYCAVRFDANGNVIGVGGSGGTGSSVAGTCWNSFGLAP